MNRKSYAYELTDGLKIHAYYLTDQKSHAYKLRMCKSRADERILVPECGKMVELKSLSNSQRNRMCQDADVKPIVRDPMDDDRILFESGAEVTPCST